MFPENDIPNCKIFYRQVYNFLYARSTIINPFDNSERWNSSQINYATFLNSLEQQRFPQEPGIIIILDTDILMLELEFIKRLHNSFIQSIGLLNFVLPNIVINELHCWRASCTKYAEVARNTLQYLSTMLSETSSSRFLSQKVMGFTEEVTMVSKKEIMINLVKHFIIPFSKQRVFLLTDDPNLFLKCRKDFLPVLNRKVFYQCFKSKETWEYLSYVTSYVSDLVANSEELPLQNIKRCLKESLVRVIQCELAIGNDNFKYFKRLSLECLPIRNILRHMLASFETEECRILRTNFTIDIMQIIEMFSDDGTTRDDCILIDIVINCYKLCDDYINHYAKYLDIHRCVHLTYREQNYRELLSLLNQDVHCNETQYNRSADSYAPNSAGNANILSSEVDIMGMEKRLNETAHCFNISFFRRNWKTLQLKCDSISSYLSTQNKIDRYDAYVIEVLNKFIPLVTSIKSNIDVLFFDHLHADIDIKYQEFLSQLENSFQILRLPFYDEDKITMKKLKLIFKNKNIVNDLSAKLNEIILCVQSFF